MSQHGRGIKHCLSFYLLHICLPFWCDITESDTEEASLIYQDTFKLKRKPNAGK